MTLSINTSTEFAAPENYPVPGQKVQKSFSFGQAIQAATAQAMRENDQVFVYAQGVNDPNGYLGTTIELKDEFSAARSFDVPLSEEALIGLGIGASILGQRPLYVALRIEFMLLAMNQIINHGAKWSSMSGEQATVPFTIRSLTGRGWGQGAQHSGNFYSIFSHFPNMQVVLPANPADAAGLLLTALTRSNAPTLILEPKPLYETKGLIEIPFEPIPFGKAAIMREGTDISFIAVSYMVSFALEVATQLEQLGISAEVLNLRTVSPLDEERIIASVQHTHNVAIFDIGWERFGLAAEIARIILTNGCQLNHPLISAAPKYEYTPAGCFLEADHYPNEKDLVQKIAHTFGVSAPNNAG